MSKLLTLWDDLTGVVFDYALSTAPSPDWMMCYGQVLLAGDPATDRLRAKLIADGFPHGQDGSGNPKVPDARGRVTAGKDNMGGVAANRLTTAGSAVDGATLGAAGGSQTHALTTAQMPSHNHGVSDPGHNHAVSDPGHNHYVNDPGHTHGLSSATVTGGGTETRINGGGSSLSTSGAVTGIYLSAAATGIGIQNKATGITTQNNGSGNAHNITQPTLVLNKIIKL